MKTSKLLEQDCDQKEEQDREKEQYDDVIKPVSV